jgi:DNA-binding NarL/FixJ family response regulator
MLTPRQLKVVALLAQGLPQREAGRRLGMKDKAVSSQLQRIKRSLGYQTTFELAFHLGLTARDALKKEA